MLKVFVRKSIIFILLFFYINFLLCPYLVSPFEISATTYIIIHEINASHVQLN